MEEPESGEIEAAPVNFTATDEHRKKMLNAKKETKKTIGERLKMRKAAPRPTMKGEGKKRFNLTPSPKIQPVFKRTIVCDNPGGGSSKGNFKRNLLGDLDEVAEEGKEEAAVTVFKGEIQKGGKVNPPGSEMEKSQQGRSETEVVIVEGQHVLETSEEKSLVRNEPATGQEAPPESVVAQPEKAILTVEGESSHPPTGDQAVQETQAIILAGSRFECQNGKEGKEPSWSTPALSFVSCHEDDILLDKITSQPLNCLTPNPLNSQIPLLEDVEMQVAATSDANTLCLENFPLLLQGTTKSIATKFENMKQTENVWNRYPISTGHQSLLNNLNGGSNVEESRREEEPAQPKIASSSVPNEDPSRLW